MFDLGIILAGLVTAQSSPSSLSVHLAADVVNEKFANLQTSRDPSSPRQEPSYAERVLRHVRGAPGTPYGSSVPELDRRLERIARE